MQYIKQWK